ncbi:UBC-like protein [Thozetella sp. PMI_491]|nr:UBC-like protein [Thozetella sp. PMI_491]
MASLKMGNLPSMKRQHLLAEFAGLKQACPKGVFMSLTPGDPSLWSGVIFVRKGPYANAVLRFQISFPDTYPNLPPLVTLSTDIFHPLITPLTTYMYTTDIQDNGTVSATDDERLPPGGFSLRHGFPTWFGRASRSRQTSAQQNPPRPDQTPPRSTGGGSRTNTPGSGALVGTPGSFMLTNKKDTSTYDVLRYIASTFDDPEVLDTVPLEAAGNPGAWHAWRTHRRQTGIVLPGEGPDDGPVEKPLPGQPTDSTTSRRPGEWNWDGVWEERSRRCITASLSEAVLYGNAGVADDVINFQPMEEADIEAAKSNISRSLGASA